MSTKSIIDIVSSEKSHFNIPHDSKMKLCRVIRHDGKSTSCFELYDSDGQFMLSAISDHTLSENWIFTTIQRAHEKELKHISISVFSASTLGQLKRNISGLVFTLFNDREKIVGQIR